MGVTGSVHSRTVTSDAMQPCESPQTHSAPNVLAEHEIMHEVCENIDNTEIVVEEELWLHQIQDLGKVIQNLAKDNLKLLTSNRELKEKCENLESCKKNDEINENSGTAINLKEELVNDKKLIEELKLQLQINTENSAAAVKKYCEDLNLMQIKVKEYELTVENLEKDLKIQKENDQPSKGLLFSTCNQYVSEESVSKRKETIEILKKDLDFYQNENKMLRKQLEEEKIARENIIEENQKLEEQIHEIKQRKCLDVDNSLEITCEISSDEVRAETYPSTSNSNSTEETRSLSSQAAAELEVFHKQMKIKREARHKALSAISQEMERLRKELHSEREDRLIAVKELETIRNMIDTHHIYEEINDLKQKLSSERKEKDKLYKEMVDIQKERNEEIENILKELENEKSKTKFILGESKILKEHLEESDHTLHLRSEENIELQNKLTTDREKYEKQVRALKDVVAISKEMLKVRENQVTHLKLTLQDIEASVIDKQHGSMTAGLRAEYETQMENMKTLKALYEERMQVITHEKEILTKKQNELQKLLEDGKRTIEILEDKLQEKEKMILERNETVSELQDQLSDAIDQSRKLSHELTVINNMFTQIIGSSDIDLDRLTKLLQENHDLITEITTKGECSETAASLPKLLLDLVCDAENNSDTKCLIVSNENSISTTSSETEKPVNSMQSNEIIDAESLTSNSTSLAMQDISSNLPKVWKVLLELVSHHIPSSIEESPEDTKTSCYKKIDTPYGPKNVISVSKTFIRLRDLILQKKSLRKEVTRLKQLNVHLETKLNDQETRLSLVSTELRKTWNVVDHMHLQHQKLHTHENVLRYELQQKRKLLMQLKDELQYCREKWEEARQMNFQSECEWQKLRDEFTLRKNKPNNNSGKSVFEEEKENGSSKGFSKLEGQRRFSNSNINKYSNDSSIGQSSEKMDETEVYSSKSLPDLVSVTTDFSLPSSDSKIPRGINSSNEESSSNNEYSIPTLKNVVTNGTAINESSSLEECPTVSLITLLKQHLSCFSQNIDIITTEFDAHDHLRALQSIFALPAIQIPNNVNPLFKEPTLQTKNYSDRENIQFADRVIQHTEKCQENLTEEKFIHECSSNSLATLEGRELCSSCPSATDHHPNTFSERKNQKKISPLKEISQDDGNCSDSVTHSHENVQEECRSQRLQRVERQCQQLFDKVTRGTEVKKTSVECEELNNEMKSQRLSNGSVRNFEDMLNAREARLKRLEEQSQQLFKKVTRTTNRSAELSTRLEVLHEQYGNEDTSGNSISNSVVSESVSSEQQRKISDPLPDNPNTSKLQSSDSSRNTTKYLSQPSTSNHSLNPPLLPSPVLSHVDGSRASRLGSLEEQSQTMFNNVTNETDRAVSTGTTLSDPPNLSLLSGKFILSNDFARNGPPKTIPVNNNTSTDSIPSTSSTNIPPPPPPPPRPPSPPPHSLSSLENVLERRAARLGRLEEQSQLLLMKAKRTTHRTEELSNRLEELHEQCNKEDITRNTENMSVKDQSDETVSLCDRLLTESNLPSTSSHIPSPPPLPTSLPPFRILMETDELRSPDNTEDVDDQEGEIHR